MPAFALLLALASCWLTACGAGSPRTESLILVTIDALRADHLGAYGYAQDTSPRIDAFAKRGATFRSAIAQAPWTRPSIGSLFTSLYPSTFGLTCHHFNLPQADCDVLPQSVLTLAERLAERGFETAGIVANIQVDEVFGFDQGFAHFENVFDALAAEDPDWRLRWNQWQGTQRSTEAVTERALHWLEENGDGPRFFLYLHYLDPHFPYAPPPPYDALFAPASYANAPEEFRGDLARYDGEIRYVDSRIGRLIDWLDRAGVSERVGVVILSDHGEAFGEHSRTRHGWTHYDEELRVPLILVLPGLTPAGIRVPSQVRLLDVMPTLLEALGAPAQDALQGHSLLPLLRGEPVDPQPAVSSWGYAPLASLRLPPWKLIINLESNVTHLHDLDDDPHELRNLSPREPKKARELGSLLGRVLARAEKDARRFEREGGEVELSPETRERLEALGYSDESP